jgi:hypothetical protein
MVPINGFNEETTTKFCEAVNFVFLSSVNFSLLDFSFPHIVKSSKNSAEE